MSRGVAAVLWLVTSRKCELRKPWRLTEPFHPMSTHSKSEGHRRFWLRGSERGGVSCADS